MKRDDELVMAAAGIGCAAILAKLGCFAVLVLIAALIIKAVMA